MKRGKLTNIFRASNDEFSEGQPPDLVAAVPDVRGLVERARRGDEEAFGELYRLHHDKVFRLARAWLDGTDAQDVVAETFCRAWSSLGRYRDTGVPFAAWLYGIARHVAADVRRAGKRVEPRAEVPDRAVDGGCPVDRVVLAAAIARLPRAQRRVVEMKFFMGLTNDEVGRALGKSAGAINAIQWRAVEALREWLR